MNEQRIQQESISERLGTGDTPAPAILINWPAPAGDKPHAEQFGFEWLAEHGIANEKVLSIYSELEPCMLADYKCKEQIATRFPNAKVSYSFPYTEKLTRVKAIKDRG